MVIKGTNPLSEPESQAIANLIQGTGFNAVINYHAMGNVIYWDTQNNQKAAESKALANAVHALNGYSVLGSKGRRRLEGLAAAGSRHPWYHDRGRTFHLPGIFLGISGDLEPE